MPPFRGTKKWTNISIILETLPGRPENFAAESLNETTIKVEWDPAINGHHLTRVYYINVTFLQ